MIDVGYFAGARAYFKRAAEAGSGDAALLLGATYDPEFIDKIGAHGIKADPKEARGWYERAKQLGVEGAEAKLKALKEDCDQASQRPIQATEAAGRRLSRSPKPRPSLSVAEAPVPADASRPQAWLSRPRPAPRRRCPTDKDEWVTMLSYANVRAAPSSTAETLRVVEKGAKLRVTGRKGNWVQVTDPATSEVGWVYSRYIETAEAPAR